MFECDKKFLDCRRNTVRIAPASGTMMEVENTGTTYRVTIESQPGLKMRCSPAGIKGSFRREGVTYTCKVSEQADVVEISLRHAAEDYHGDVEFLQIVKFPIAGGPCTAIGREYSTDDDRPAPGTIPLANEFRHNGDCKTQ